MSAPAADENGSPLLGQEGGNGLRTMAGCSLGRAVLPAPAPLPKPAAPAFPSSTEEGRIFRGPLHAAGRHYRQMTTDPLGFHSGTSRLLCLVGRSEQARMPTLPGTFKEVPSTLSEGPVHLLQEIGHASVHYFHKRPWIETYPKDHDRKRHEGYRFSQAEVWKKRSRRRCCFS